mmetsp:Transcript_28439/g.54789  ORF Transcript_28439/g.54789 Transcript_28439/m.54789 type:complete len:829 (-) Transcript_28439:77-2563(-)
MVRSVGAWFSDTLFRATSFPRDGLNYDWVFTFPLPYVSAEGFLTATGQPAFERQLRRRQIKIADLLGQAYEEAIGGGQHEVLRSVLRKFHPVATGKHSGVEHEPATDVDLESPLLPGGRDVTMLSNSTLETCDPDYSLARAQECTILLFIATLRSIDSFCREELRKMGDGSDPGEQVTFQLFPGSCGQKLYVCCDLSTPAAELLAEFDEYPLQLAQSGLASLGLQVQDVEHRPAHVSFSREHRELFHMTKRDSSNAEQTVLRPIDFIRLLHNKVTDLIDLSMLKHHGLFCEGYPLHAREKLWQLQTKFHFCYNILWPGHWHCIHTIRHNFGEEIALYFYFLRELSASLAVLSVFVVCIMIWQHYRCYDLSEEDACPETAATCAFAAIVMVWFRIFTLRWYQRESRCSASWGISAHGQTRLKETPNARLQCGFVQDPVDSRRRIRKAPAWLQGLGIACSVVLTTLFVFVLLLLVAAEHFGYHILVRKTWDNPEVPHYLTIALGVMTGIQIKVVDAVWDTLSDWITDFEYRWTEQGFLDSKRIKCVTVKFITGVCTMVYMAIIAATIESTFQFEEYSQRLSTQLKSLFFTRYILLGALNRIAKPYLTLRFKYWWQSDGKRLMTFTEVQALMEEYTDSDLSCDYMDVLVPLSLVLFFGLVSPAIVLLMLVLVMSQFRADMWKLVHTYRRPFPRAIKANHVFNDFMEFSGVSMIFMNLAMITIIAVREPSWNAVVDDNQLSTPHFCAAMLGVSLWFYLAWLVPSKSGQTIVEERRHFLESQTFHRLRRPAEHPAKLDVAAACPTACPDFTGLMCPKASRATQKIVREGLHLA